MYINDNRLPVLSLDDVRARAPSVFAVDKSPSRGDRYTYIPTSQVVEGLIAQGFVPTSATESKARKAANKGYTRHAVRFTRPDIFRADTLALGGLYPEVVVSNAHDGSAAYRIEAGLLRLVCLNGMLVSSSTIADVRVRHSGKVLDDVIEGVFTVVRSSERTLAVASDWARMQLDSKERLSLAYAAHAIRFGSVSSDDADADPRSMALSISPAELLRPVRYGDDKPDLWTTFNLLQERAIRGGSRGYNASGRRRVKSREVKAVDSSARINRALWQMAARFAELKGVPAAA